MQAVQILLQLYCMTKSIFLTHECVSHDVVILAAASRSQKRSS